MEKEKRGALLEGSVKKKKRLKIVVPMLRTIVSFL